MGSQSTDQPRFPKVAQGRAGGQSSRSCCPGAGGKETWQEQALLGSGQARGFPPRSQTPGDVRAMESSAAAGTASPELGRGAGGGQPSPHKPSWTLGRPTSPRSRGEQDTGRRTMAMPPTLHSSHILVSNLSCRQLRPHLRGEPFASAWMREDTWVLEGSGPSWPLRKDQGPCLRSRMPSWFARGQGGVLAGRPGLARGLRNRLLRVTGRRCSQGHNLTLSLLFPAAWVRGE